MGLINTRNAILTPDCKSLLTCYICLCVPTITGSCQPKPSGSGLSPPWPHVTRDRCVPSGDHLYSAQYIQTHQSQHMSFNTYMSPALARKCGGHKADHLHYCRCKIRSKTGSKFPSQKETASLL